MTKYILRLERGTRRISSTVHGSTLKADSHSGPTQTQNPLDAQVIKAGAELPALCWQQAANYKSVK